MTHHPPMAKPKPKPKPKPVNKPKPVFRSRTRKREIYLSKSEDRIFAAMLKRQNATASQVFRDWLLRAQAQWMRRHKQPDAADPRQLTIAGAERVA